MNAKDRKTLGELLAKIDDARIEIEEMKDEEQEKLDNQPESIQESEKGENWQALIDALDEFTSTLDQAHSDLTSTDGLEDVD
jgi:hypothetical protein